MKKRLVFLAGVFLLMGVSIQAHAMPPKNHYKTWKLVPPPSFVGSAQVRDQFIPSDVLQLGQIDYLSNPTRKDNFFIVNTDLHYSWFRATGLPAVRTFKYTNQFVSNQTVSTGAVRYLLVPTTKQGHSAPGDLATHYKAYEITNEHLIAVPRQLEDQFDIADGAVENVNNFRARYFLTPCNKNGVAALDSATHYVAYHFDPNRLTPQVRSIVNQFGGFVADADSAKFLLVPTQKIIPNLPGLSIYGLILLALLLAGTAVWLLRRRVATKGGLA